MKGHVRLGAWKYEMRLEDYAEKVGRSLSSVKKESAARPDLLEEKMKILVEGGDPEVFAEVDIKVRLCEQVLVLNAIKAAYRDLTQAIKGDGHCTRYLISEAIETLRPLLDGDHPALLGAICPLG
jgi:hypothetical protein